MIIKTTRYTERSVLYTADTLAQKRKSYMVYNKVSTYQHNFLPMDNDDQIWQHICYKQNNVLTGVAGESDMLCKTDVNVMIESRLALKYPENIHHTHKECKMKTP